MTGCKHRVRLSTVSHANLINNILDEACVFPCHCDKGYAIPNKGLNEFLKSAMEASWTVKYNFRQIGHNPVSNQENPLPSLGEIVSVIHDANEVYDSRHHAPEDDHKSGEGAVNCNEQPVENKCEKN